MTLGLTAALGRFASETRFGDIPQATLPTIRSGFADCAGVMIAGGAEETVAVLNRVFPRDRDEATVLFDPARRASAPLAALLNATAAHALDLDDVAMRGHPSAVLVPAILAEAEVTGATGQQMALAYAVGYETWGELQWRDRDPHHEKGWHPTGIFGPVAAAAACASLRGLSAADAATSIAIGASHSSGLVANFGTMTKPLHVGRAAQAGILSARLAEAGFTATSDALEHPLGFLSAVSKASAFDAESSIRIGGHWRLESEGLTIKKYSVCFATHCALDGLLDLVAGHGLEADEVQAVTVTVNRRHGAILRHPRPATALEAKFSMPFAMACALIAGRAGNAELVDEFVARPDVQDMIRRVEVRLLDEDPERPGFSSDDRVIVTTRDGRRLDSGRLTTIRGGPESPLGPDELWQKFSGCVVGLPLGFEPRALFDALMGVDTLRDTRDIPGLGGPAPGQGQRDGNAISG